jgi:hypothetical protein
MRDKIDKITNWTIQLFFERAGVNFKGIREKREERKKTPPQPNRISTLSTGTLPEKR